MRKNNWQSKDVFFIVSIVVVFIVFSAGMYTLGSRFAGSSCDCLNVYSTNVSVDDDSLGAALMFYLLESYSIIDTRRVSLCDKEMYYVNFATRNDNNQTLYIDGDGNVYSCG